MSDSSSAPGSGTSFDQGGPIPISDQCDLLANDRRRALLHYLVGRPREPVEVDEIVDYLVGGELGGDRQTIAVSLRHVHLPLLAEFGVIWYTAACDRVEYLPQPDLEELLAFLEDE